VTADDRFQPHQFDRVGDATAAQAAAYLDRARSNPLFQRIKERTLSHLDLKNGDHALDVGCGTGEEVVAMAKLVSPDGRAVGVDLSEAMITEAEKRAADVDLPVEFRVAGNQELPFPDASFSACRTERVLVHTSDPARAVGEMIRILEPGGRIAIVEPDFEALVYDSPQTEVGQRIKLHWLATGRNSPMVGRTLYGLFVRAGLAGILVEGHVGVLNDYALAQNQFAFEERAASAANDGAVSTEEAERWVDSLREAAAEDRFFASGVIFSAFARKPELLADGGETI